MRERPYRIVIIEDNPEDRVAYRRRIAHGREQDFQFWETGSGEEGLRMCREVDPDCILLDYQLPDLDGLAFLDRFPTEVGRAHIPVIMLTGYGNEAVAVEAMKKGAQDYLIKNLNSDKVSQAVQSAIDKEVMRRQIEEQRRELESLSAERLQLVAELKQQTAALSEANQRKDEFLATLAHELRNPLAPISNALQILRLSGGGDRIHEMMERQVNHMVRLVDDLLEVSRITRGNIELRRERVDLAAVVHTAVETSRPFIEASGHRLAITLPSEPVVLEADPVRLAQIIANLLNNAAKYTEQAGEIELTVRREADEAVVSVRDSGVGIPADMLSRIFDMFAQVDRSLKRAHGGLGIGLALARNLVEMHGGRIEARSDGAGKGSEFTVHLPLKFPQHAVSEGPLTDQPQHVHHGPRRVLVVDDNRDAADSLGMLLRYVGADAQVVYDGSAALEALRSYRPAVVFLDIGMPDMDGHQVARRVRQHPEFADTVLIALTGWSQEEDRHRSLAAGFNHHLVKPTNVNALQALLASLDRVP